MKNARDALPPLLLPIPSSPALLPPLPVHISQIKTPNEYMSADSLHGSPMSSSGAICGVAGTLGEACYACVGGTEQLPLRLCRRCKAAAHMQNQAPAVGFANARSQRCRGCCP